MKKLWHQLREDESGFLISSELVIIGTVGVLAMVVGLEAISSAVIQELNDLAGAFGALDQSYNYRSIMKFGHARVRGSGFNDTTDFCDCIAISQTDVVGKMDSGFGSESTSTFAPGVFQSPVFQNPATPIVVEPLRAVPCAPCKDRAGEIIEERIIRPRPSVDDRSGNISPQIPPAPSQP